MSRKTLVEAVDEIDWHPEFVDFISEMLKFSLTDQGGAAVVVAAATLFARDLPSDLKGSGIAIDMAGSEFADLIRALRSHIEARPCTVPTTLTVVGGTDFALKGA